MGGTLRTKRSAWVLSGTTTPFWHDTEPKDRLMGSHVAVRDLEAICGEVGRILYENGHHHSCIVGSALLLQVLHGLGYSEAYPLTVGVQICNRKFQQWVEQHGSPNDEASSAACNEMGGVEIIIGKEGEGLIAADRWAGHLAVAIPNHFGDRHALCDLTIGQANRPEWEVQLPPLICLRVRDDFVSGASPFQTVINGSLVIYNALPDDRSYSEGRDWLAIDGLDTASSIVIHALGVGSPTPPGFGR